MKRRWITTAALALAAAGCAPGTPADQGAEVPRNVRVVDVARADLTEYYEVSGPVVPVRAADLSAQESGPVVAIVAGKGEAVPAGGTIVEQERDILAADLAAARADRATQEFNLDKVRKLHEPRARSAAWNC